MTLDHGRRNALMATLAPVALAALPSALRAQAWPARPVRIIAPSAAGGSTDIIARTLAERFTRAFNQPVVVENRPGGTGTVALDAVAKSAPDGYTLGIGFSGSNVIYPLLNDKLPFNAQKDLMPIGHIATTGNVLVVHPSVPVRTLPELLAYLRAQPADKPAVYGSWGNGSGGHLAGEYLKLLTGVPMNHVPYRSASALTTDMVGGHIQVGFLDPSNARPQGASGKLRLIVQTGAARIAVLPDVPTMIEQGVDFGVGIWFGLFGPAGLPAAVVERLNTELREALLAPDLAERWVNAAGNRPAPTSPEEFARTVRADWEVWKKVIEQGKISL